MNLHSHWKMSGPSHERNHSHPSLHVQSPQTSPPRQRGVTAKFLLQLFGGTTSEIFLLKFLQIFEFGWGPDMTREAETLIHHAAMSATRSTRCHRHVPTSFRGAFKARRVQLGTLWIADLTCLSLLTVCKQGGKKTFKCPFGMWWVKV